MEGAERGQVMLCDCSLISRRVWIDALFGSGRGSDAKPPNCRSTTRPPEQSGGSTSEPCRLSISWSNGPTFDITINNTTKMLIQESHKDVATKADGKDGSMSMWDTQSNEYSS